MKRGWVRIIAGKWRGRKIQVPILKDLRPTPDRVRETLFNWLSPVLSGAYCLDLFAGSGALGFEALSRGAAYVELIDQSPEAVICLQKEARALSAENVRIYQAKVPEQLNPPTRRFDIVFLDPPYLSHLLIPCCRYLEEYNFLAQPAAIYLEAREVIKDNMLPSNWHILKANQAGQVYYHLAQRADHHSKNIEKTHAGKIKTTIIDR